MHGLLLPALAASTFAILAFAASPLRAEQYRVSDPITHDNLTIYFLHGKSAEGPVPLTLEEALARHTVRVLETGDVNQLTVENIGTEDVFIQSGDIVKGGRQDRALTASLLLAPRSGRVPLAAFCVEQGRWSARGDEDSRAFARSGSMMPSRQAKVAMRAPASPNAAPSAPSGSPRRAAGYDDTSRRQSEVWRRVEAVQRSLSEEVGAKVNSPASESSLQLALENEKLLDVQAAYIKDLEAAGTRDDDVIGYVFAINGKINSADVYPSNGLFRKMWGKLLRASVTEAIGERKGAGPAAPTAKDVLAFLDEAQKGKADERALPADIQLETRSGDKALYFETRRGAEWVHRNYLAM